MPEQAHPAPAEVPAGGLSAAVAAHRLAEDGPNALPDRAHRGALGALADALLQPMILLLGAAAVIYVVIGDARDAAVLAASVFMVIAITVYQARRSERALEALRDLSSPRALVVRDGQTQRIAGRDVVCGDLLLVSEGDRVPADARLVHGASLAVDESLLTGESLAVEKSPGADGREGLVFSGTLVTRGHARAVVTATGARAEIGRIGQSLATIEPERTALEVETARVVRWIAVLAITLCVLLAVFHALTRGDPFGGVLAGLTLAIAILPEEFPVVLTVFLALGAWRIARHRVLTRRMAAIEMLGAATVLCVDKTGTLTENRMAVARAYANLHEGPRWFGGIHLHDPSARSLLEAAAFACELEPFDPMDRAILAAASEADATLAARRAQWRLAQDYDFGTGFLAMCHGWRAPEGATRTFIKGAPETVLPLCHLDDATRERAHREIEHAAAQGLRLLAVGEAGGPAQGAGWPEDPAHLQIGRSHV